MSIEAIEKSPETNTLTPIPKPQEQRQARLTVVGDMVLPESPSPVSIDYSIIKAEIDRASAATKLGGLALLDVVLVRLGQIPPAPSPMPANPAFHPVKEVRVPSPHGANYVQKLAESEAQKISEAGRQQRYVEALEQLTIHDDALSEYKSAADIYASEDPTVGYMIEKPGTGWGRDLKKVGELYDTTEFAESTLVINTLKAMMNDPDGRFVIYKTSLIEADRIARIKVLAEQKRDAQDIVESLTPANVNGVTVLVATLEKLHKVPEDQVERRKLMNEINQANCEIAELAANPAEGVLNAVESTDPILIKLKGMRQIAELDESMHQHIPALTNAEYIYCLMRFEATQ